MKDTSSIVIRREDYRPPPYTIHAVALEFQLDEELTRVQAKSQVRRAPGAPADAPLVLDGQGMTLESIAIDGRALDAEEYTLTEESLSLPGVPERFALTIVSSLS